MPSRPLGSSSSCPVPPPPGSLSNFCSLPGKVLSLDILSPHPEAGPAPSITQHVLPSPLSSKARWGGKGVPDARPKAGHSGQASKRFMLVAEKMRRKSEHKPSVAAALNPGWGGRKMHQAANLGVAVGSEGGPQGWLSYRVSTSW